MSQGLEKNLFKELIYRATHRGMKELDVVLGEFALLKLRKMSSTEICAFKRLLEMEDGMLFKYIFREEEIPHDVNKQLLLRLRRYVRERPSNI